MKKIFIFDFDGVIVDSFELYNETTNLCLEMIGQPIIRNREDFLDLFDDNFYEAICKKGVDVVKFNRMAQIIATHVDYNRVAPFQQLMPIFEVLKKDSILLIVSSNSFQAIHIILSKYGYVHYFEEIFGADFMLSKVDKINYIIETWEVTKDHVYFIGDTVGDIKEAQEVGIKTVAVTWGWHTKKRLEKVQPDYLIDNPDELLRIASYTDQ